MPSPAAIILAARRIPWTRVLWLAREAHRRGSAVAGELDAQERRRFIELVRASRGRPDRNLPHPDRNEFAGLAARAWAAARRPHQPPPR